VEAFIPVALLGEIAQGAMKPADVSGRAVLVAHVGDEHFVFVRQCPHADADLAEGELVGGLVICNNHGYRFDVATGNCALPGAECPGLTVLPVVERDGAVCVKISW